MTNLVAYWRLDESSGTRVDATGNGHDLTSVGTVGNTTGAITNAADFGGTGKQDLARDDAAFRSDQSFTASAWENFSTPASAGSWGVWDTNTGFWNWVSGAASTI